MTSEMQEQPPEARPLGQRFIAIGGRLLYLIYAWAFTLIFIGWLKLGANADFSDIFDHLRTDPFLVVAVTIAFLAGFRSATPSSRQQHSDWMYRHPLATQALVGAAIAAMFLVPLLVVR